MANVHSDPTEIGANIRRRRLALSLTLNQLAEASQVSPTMLSEVERAVKNPTVKLAYQIARALGCSLTDLLDSESTPPTAVLRASGRRTLVDPESGVERHGLSPELLKRGLELVRYRIPAGGTTGEMAPNRLGILEHVVVTEGVLTLRLRDETHVLDAEDSITYGPQVPVEYANESAAACSFLLLSDATRAR